jgi:hypothetical protein
MMEFPELCLGDLPSHPDNPQFSVVGPCKIDFSLSQFYGRKVLTGQNPQVE